MHFTNPLATMDTSAPPLLLIAIIAVAAYVLGSISTSQVSIASVDIGLAQLAMHSCNETAGVEDSEAMILAIQRFYSTHRSMPQEGVLIQQAD